MDLLLGDISLLVFKAIPREDLGEISLDGRTLRLLLEFDGKRTVFDIANRLNVSVSQLKPVISKLLEAKLIELTEEGVPKVDKDFLNYLTSELALAVGPLAKLIIEDAVEELGCSIDNFPVTYLAELVETVSKEIPREEKKNTFRKNIINKMREKGY
jgi:predicted transcriptional regulator